MFKGSIVAIATPFKDGRVDEATLRELVEFQIAHKTSAIVPCGTTGESPTLSHEEHGRVIEIVVKQVRKRVPVIAGTGSNSTAETLSLTRHAKACGADAALTVIPYYNKPTQAGLIAHFSTVAKEVSIPIIVYNIPSRSVVNMAPATLIRLAEKHKNIVGVKESSGSMDQASEIARALNHRNFCILSGDDSLTLPLFSVGARGVISVLANIAPRAVAELCRFALAGDFKKAQAAHFKMFPLIKALFIESNPAPLKAAMEMMKLCSSELRLPMVPISSENRKVLAREMKAFGLLK